MQQADAKSNHQMARLKFRSEKNDNTLDVSVTIPCVVN